MPVLCAVQCLQSELRHPQRPVCSLPGPQPAKHSRACDAASHMQEAMKVAHRVVVGEGSPLRTLQVSGDISGGRHLTARRAHARQVRLLLLRGCLALRPRVHATAHAAAEQDGAFMQRRLIRVLLCVPIKFEPAWRIQ